MRLQSILCGYYKDRIKGSNLEIMRTKFCRIFILGSIPMGFLTYLLIRPILKKKQESGGFDDFPSFVYKREQFRTWTDNNSTGVIRTRAEYDRTINEIVSDEFHDV